MASSNSLFILIPLLTATLFTITLCSISVDSSVIYPLNCTQKLLPTPCSSYLYHISEGGLTTEQIASYYSVNTSQIQPIKHNAKQDYVVSVPCGCKDVNGTVSYFYDTSYTVQTGDTLDNVTTKIYSGQPWKAGGDSIFAGQIIPIHLVCGCLEGVSQVVVTYTVQDQDTLSGIAGLLSSTVEGIQSLNPILTQNPGFLDVGWVLFVPMQTKGTQSSS
ncbi:hypothetical protein IFM89_006354 [Coptis chinensis]|uniref:LysM domain-containing protein n=1 Tax=Coptis chinensis TaxID=261450 RepID=A0A835HU99_9MAGN|nr:hypothetical protein IFM89_006354 [Coptis chinensis]